MSWLKKTKIAVGKQNRKTDRRRTEYLQNVWRIRKCSEIQTNHKTCWDWNTGYIHFKNGWILEIFFRLGDIMTSKVWDWELPCQNLLWKEWYVENPSLYCLRFVMKNGNLVVKQNICSTKPIVSKLVAVTDKTSFATWSNWQLMKELHSLPFASSSVLNSSRLLWVLLNNTIFSPV